MPIKTIFELSPEEIEKKKLERFKQYFGWGNYLDSIDEIINLAEKKGSPELVKRAKETKKAVDREFDIGFHDYLPMEVGDILDEYPGMFIKEIIEKLKKEASGSERYDTDRAKRLDAAEKAKFLEEFEKREYENKLKNLKEMEKREYEESEGKKLAEKEITKTKSKSIKKDKTLQDDPLSYVNPEEISSETIKGKEAKGESAFQERRKLQEKENEVDEELKKVNAEIYRARQEIESKKQMKLDDFLDQETREAIKNSPYKSIDEAINNKQEFLKGIQKKLETATGMEKEVLLRYAQNASSEIQFLANKKLEANDRMISTFEGEKDKTRPPAATAAPLIGEERSSIPGGKTRPEETTTQRTYLTPHEEYKGAVYNTQAGKQVDPERLKLLGIQEAAKRIADKPFEENPYAIAAALDPLVEEGINIEREIERETKKQPTEFKFPESSRKEAIERFINPSDTQASLEAKMAMRRYLDPEQQNTMAMTLRDKIMEDVRRKAVKRLEDSYRDLGLKLSAQRIGRNTFEDVQKRKMLENMNNELNALDNETLMKLLQQQKQQSKEEVEQTTRAHELERAHGLNAAQIAMKADEEEKLRALEAYRINKIMEEARLAERRKSASAKISAGQLKTIQKQEELNRKSEEFMRRQRYPQEQIGSYLNTLKGASLGTTPYTLPERVQQHAPVIVPELAPQKVEREIPGGLQPVIEVQQPDTTLRDTMGLVTGLGSLGLETYKALKPEKK